MKIGSIKLFIIVKMYIKFGEWILDQSSKIYV